MAARNCRVVPGALSELRLYAYVQALGKQSRGVRVRPVRIRLVDSHSIFRGITAVL